MTGKFLYTRLDMTESPTGVETENGSERVSRLTLNWIAILGVTKEIVSPGSTNA